MANEIRVPTLGESVTEATIGQWFKKPGDAVKADEPLVELETDKVTVEVPAPASGVMGEIVAKEGETVEVGALLGTVGEGSGKTSAPAASAKDEKKKEAAPPPAPEKARDEQSQPAGKPGVPASPSAAKMLAENQMSPDQVEGSGKRRPGIEGRCHRGTGKGREASSARRCAGCRQGAVAGR